mmetsp:Transcript_5818/g.14148  ORF Transcript_5818/g.14148 Transcript_5818/m.14148 type:complete len:272 (+) Transcript_5818:481-1296(+)
MEAVGHPQPLVGVPLHHLVEIEEAPTLARGGLPARLVQGGNHVWPLGCVVLVPVVGRQVRVRAPAVDRCAGEALLRVVHEPLHVAQVSVNDLLPEVFLRAERVSLLPPSRDVPKVACQDQHVGALWHEGFRVERRVHAHPLRRRVVERRNRRRLTEQAEVVGVAGPEYEEVGKLDRADRHPCVLRAGGRGKGVRLGGGQHRRTALGESMGGADAEAGKVCLGSESLYHSANPLRLQHPCVPSVPRPSLRRGYWHLPIRGARLETPFHLSPA